jgi:hypothetical protein
VQSSKGALLEKSEEIQERKEQHCSDKETVMAHHQKAKVLRTQDLN